jgi:hypothetical protein
MTLKQYGTLLGFAVLTYASVNASTDEHWWEHVITILLRVGGSLLILGSLFLED